MAEVNVNAPSPVCIDCGGPKRPGKGARCGSCSGKRRVARRAELMALYEAGQYTPGSYHREATCKGCGRVFPVTRHDNLGCCSRGCASAVVGAARRIYADKLDHIIPLARGGEHSYANTACACRACNMAKGATPKGQMLMFASPVG